MSIGELLNAVKDQLENDPLVSAAVSSVITPEGRTLLATIVAGVADLESKHEAAKAAAVADAHAAGVAEGQAATAPPETPAP